MTFEQETDLLCVYLYDLIQENEDADGHLLSSSDSEKLMNCAERLNAQTRLIESYKDEMREMASSLGAGGYNSTDVTPKVFAEKIRFGVNHIVSVESKRRDDLRGALQQEQARFDRLKPALEMLSKKLGRFTADPLDARVIIEAAASEIDQLRARLNLSFGKES